MYSYQHTPEKKNERSASAAVRQLKVKNTAKALADNRPQRTVQLKPNNTGLPDQLKSGIENLSGYSLHDVKVHYNSPKPAQLNAHAYAQGTDIHVASGQEKHLPHEAWHVVQQKQGRVRATKQLKSSVPLNDEDSLEKEADRMGRKALQMKADKNAAPHILSANAPQIVQRSIFNKLIGNTASDLVTMVGGGILGIGGPSVVNAPTYGPRTGRGFGTYMDAKLNNPHPGTGTGSGDDNSTWKTLKKRRIGSTSYYVQAHLLSAKLGGSGTNWSNLVPLTTGSNQLMETGIESHVKLAVGLGQTVRYKVQAFYGQWPWQWPAYWANMLTSPWLRLLMRGMYSTLADLRDAEQHVPSVLYAQWWVEGGSGSWIPYVRRIVQKPNSGGGFWVLNGADNQVYDMNRPYMVWKLAEQSVASFMMPMILPKLMTYGFTKEMAAVLTPTQFLQGLVRVSGNISQWMFNHKYDLDAYFKFLDEYKLRRLADILLGMLGTKMSITTGKSHSANRELVGTLASLNHSDAAAIHAMPVHTTRSGSSFEKKHQ